MLWQSFLNPHERIDLRLYKRIANPLGGFGGLEPQALETAAR